MRKNIDISKETNKALTAQALDNDTNVKNFIERQLETMGETGIPYLDLWDQCQSLTKQLQQLCNQK